MDGEKLDQQIEKNLAAKKLGGAVKVIKNNDRETTIFDSDFLASVTKEKGKNVWYYKDQNLNKVSFESYEEAVAAVKKLLPKIGVKILAKAKRLSEDEIEKRLAANTDSAPYKGHRITLDTENDGAVYVVITDPEGKKYELKDLFESEAEGRAEAKRQIDRGNVQSLPKY